MYKLQTVQIGYDHLLTIQGLVTRSVAKKQNVGNDARASENKEPCSFWKTKASIVALMPGQHLMGGRV